jgi:hypothetical protein
MSWRVSVNVVGSSIRRRYASTTTANNGLKSSQEVLHTLRALLRECTYLPDAQARSYLFQHILSRFRAYTLKEKVVDPIRLQSQQQTAQSALNQLRRANQGERHPLLKVLLLTYGRIGKRRWDLMRPLLPAEGQDGKGASQARTADMTEEGNGDEEKPLPSLTPQLHALLSSHAKAEPPTLTRLNPHQKKLQPDVPEVNSWLRPMPKSRVRNLTKKWYRSVLERVLPPLPREEWEMLWSLARGKLDGDVVVKRRKRTGESVNERGASAALEAIVAGGKVPAERVGRDTHLITPRSMQRMWAKVFVQCAMMEWDGEKERWVVTWGEHALHSGGGGSRST